MHDAPLSKRPIRSFVIRNGRMTPSQQLAIDTLFPVYGLEYVEQPLNLETVFGNTNPVWLEIGFGDGEALMAMAEARPDTNFIGIEVHAPGVGHLLAGIERRDLPNIRVIRHDALDVLTSMIPATSIARILLLFPDPWHKKRHHKRRILNEETIPLIAGVLVKQGVLHCATDWAEYAESMLEVLEASELSNLNHNGAYSERPDYRPLTKFEQRGLRLGHEVADLLYVRE